MPLDTAFGIRTALQRYLGYDVKDCVARMKLTTIAAKLRVTAAEMEALAALGEANGTNTDRQGLGKNVAK